MKLFVALYIVVLVGLVGVGALFKEFQADQCDAAGGTPIRSIVGIYEECVPAN